MLEELQAAVGTVTERVGPATVTIGRDRRGTGRGDRRRAGAHQRPQPARPHHPGDLRRRPRRPGRGRSAPTPTATSPSSPSTPPARPPPSGRRRTPVAGQVVFAAARGRQGLRVTFGVVSGVDRVFRGRAAAGSPAAWSTPPRSPEDRPAARSSTPRAGWSGSTPTASATASTSPSPPTPGSASGSTSSPPASRPTRRRLGIAVAPSFVARRLRRAVGLPERDGLLVRGVEDGSPAAAAGVSSGDLIVAANGADVRTADDLWAVLDVARSRGGGRGRARDRAGRRRADGPCHVRRR